MIAIAGSGNVMGEMEEVKRSVQQPNIEPVPLALPYTMDIV